MSFQLDGWTPSTTRSFVMFKSLDFYQDIEIWNTLKLVINIVFRIYYKSSKSFGLIITNIKKNDS